MLQNYSCDPSDLKNYLKSTNWKVQWVKSITTRLFLDQTNTNLKTKDWILLFYLWISNKSLHYFIFEPMKQNGVLCLFQFSQAMKKVKGSFILGND